VEFSFYPGCTAHSTAIEYSMSIHAVFDALGIGLSDIDDWNCCGAAAAHSLSEMLGLALPARNIAKAQEKDLTLAVPCAGCFNALKRAEKALAPGSDKRAELEEVVGFTYRDTLRIKSLVDVVVNEIGLDAIRERVTRPLAGLKVASYYGCALVRDPKVTNMGDHENPVFLDDLVDCLGGTPIDWSAKTDCCGADLALTHGTIVEDLVAKIVGNAVDAGADCLVCCCGLCQINVEMRQAAGTGVPAFYFTELMGLAMDLDGRNTWWSKHIVNPAGLLKSRGLEG
jgi:heterodisulfide reductase subunit B